MKRHMIKWGSCFLESGDDFMTWCGISEWDTPSEELMEHFVYKWDDCDCKRCRAAYYRDMKRHEELMGRENRAFKK